MSIARSLTQHELNAIKTVRDLNPRPARHARTRTRRNRRVPLLRGAHQTDAARSRRSRFLPLRRWDDLPPHPDSDHRAGSGRQAAGVPAPPHGRNVQAPRKPGKPSRTSNSRSARHCGSNYSPSRISISSGGFSRQFISSTAASARRNAKPERFKVFPVCQLHAATTCIPRPTSTRSLP